MIRSTKYKYFCAKVTILVTLKLLNCPLSVFFYQAILNWVWFIVLFYAYFKIYGCKDAWSRKNCTTWTILDAEQVSYLKKPIDMDLWRQYIIDTSNKCWHRMVVPPKELPFINNLWQWLFNRKYKIVINKCLQ